MAWYLKREGGDAEGPLDEEAIIARLRTGERREALVREGEGGEWRAMASHPPFAHALRATLPDGTPTAESVGRATAAPSATPDDTQPAPAPEHAADDVPPSPPAAAEVVAPPPAAAEAVAPPPAAPPSPAFPQPTATATTTRTASRSAAARASDRAPPLPGLRPSPTARLLLIGTVACFVLLIAFAATFLFAPSSGSRLAAYIPKNVDVYVEVPSTKSALAALKGVAILDAQHVDEKKVVDDLVKGFTAAFDLSPTDARALVVAVDTMGGAARRISRRGTEVAAVLHFTSGAEVEKLVASKRFALEGAMGKTGKSYRVTEAPGRDAGDGVSRLLARVTAGGPDGALAVAWFEKKKLLVHGARALVADIAAVIDEEEESLEKSPSFAAAKASLASQGAALLVFGEVSALRGASDGPAAAHGATHDEARRLFDGYLKKDAPVTATARLDGAGMVVKARGKLTGDSVPDEKLFGAPLLLKLARKLPRQTLAYAAFSTKLGLGAKEAAEALVAQVREVVGRSFDRDLAKWEKVNGLTAEVLVGALGEQGVVALVAPQEKPVEALRSLERAAAIVLLQVKDRKVAETLAARVREHVLEDPKLDLRVTADGTGYMAEAQGKRSLFLRVKILDDDVVFVGAGASDLVERSLDAYREGKDELGDDPAFKTTWKTLPEDAHAQLWVDMGRVLADVARSDQTDAGIRKLFAEDSPLKLTGDDRIITAAALRLHAHAGAWDVEVDALNPFGPALLLASAAEPKRKDVQAPPRLPPPPPHK